MRQNKNEPETQLLLDVAGTVVPMTLTFPAPPDQEAIRTPANAAAAADWVLNALTNQPVNNETAAALANSYGIHCKRKPWFFSLFRASNEEAPELVKELLSAIFFKYYQARRDTTTFNDIYNEFSQAIKKYLQNIRKKAAWATVGVTGCASLLGSITWFGFLAKAHELAVRMMTNSTFNSSAATADETYDSPIDYGVAPLAVSLLLPMTLLLIAVGASQTLRHDPVDIDLSHLVLRVLASSENPEKISEKIARAFQWLESRIKVQEPSAAYVVDVEMTRFCR